MGGEDIPGLSEENIASEITAPNTQRGKAITAVLSVAAIAFKVAEVAAIGPLAFLIDAVIATTLQEKAKEIFKGECND